jgi:putative DNA methylase
MLDRDAPKLTKTEQIAVEVAKAIGAGKAVAVETVDFNDPHRPKTCLEVDFPILPVNRVAQIEGNAGKPIYQMSKWWARRRSSVFRSLLLAAAMKAPDDADLAAKAVWDVYYANHQKRGALRHLKVADIFMGGGTTLVEGSRLGMQMYGNDLNPIAWFVVKNEFAKVTSEEVQALLDDVEAEVKPQLMPFYACDGPDGEIGTWTRMSDGLPMGDDFDPLALPPEERKLYKYEGPEIIYTFWAKHGPCQITGCGHRTPIMTTPEVSVKAVAITAWGDRSCPKCKRRFDLEPCAVRMAPDVPLVIAASEQPFAVLEHDGWTACPHCGHLHQRASLGKPNKKKRIALTLLVHPKWLAGSPRMAKDGASYGGAAQDDADSTARWNRARAKNLRLIEVRGVLPDEITCPDTGATLRTGKAGGNVPKNASFTCAACGTTQSILATTAATGKTGPWAEYAVQAYSPARDEAGAPYGGRFFSPASNFRQLDAAIAEWAARKDADLSSYWPRSKIPFGHMTHQRQPLFEHGFTHWWTMFNPRQLLTHSILLKAIAEVGDHRSETRDFVLGAFQQYLRNQSMFCIWNAARDSLEPQFSNNNFHPKATAIENSVFTTVGRGNWNSCIEGLLEVIYWSAHPLDTMDVADAAARDRFLANLLDGVTAKGIKIEPRDPVGTAMLACKSATELDDLADAHFDLVITDPPFGGLLHYSELADFFHVWLRLGLRDRYPNIFFPRRVPKPLRRWLIVRASRLIPTAFINGCLPSVGAKRTEC